MVNSYSIWLYNILVFSKIEVISGIVKFNCIFKHSPKDKERIIAYESHNERYCQ